MFTDFVNWILQAILNAEEQGVTQSSYLTVPPSNLFGNSYALAFQNAIHSIGNYEEVYERNIGKIVPRSGLNELNQGSTRRIIGGEFHLTNEGLFFIPVVHWMTSRQKDLSLVVSMFEQALPSLITQHRLGQVWM